MEAVTPQGPIKVLRIIARLNVGGPALHCLLLSKQLRQEGFDTTLVTGSSETEEAEYETLFNVSTEGFRLVRLKRLRRTVKYWGDLLTLVELIRLIRRERPQIVHTHTAKAGLLGRIAAIVAGVPVVVHTFHGHVLSGYFSPTLSTAIRWLERLLAKGTSAIVTLSPSLQRELSTKFRIAPSEKFRVIPLGRDLTPFFDAPKLRGEFRRELDVSDEETLVMGIVGRLVPIKDHLTLFEACARLRKDCRWKLAVIGDGELSETLRERVKSLGIEANIHFLGWRSDLPRIYASLDLCVLASKNEGTPLSIIEAFASGCPVLATAVGGVPDMLAEGGVLVPPGNPAAMAQAIEALAGNPQRREALSVQARAQAEQYSDAALVRRVASLYRELSC